MALYAQYMANERVMLDATEVADEAQFAARKEFPKPPDSLTWRHSDGTPHYNNCMKGTAGNIFASLGLPVENLKYLGIDPNLVTTGPQIQALIEAAELVIAEEPLSSSATIAFNPLCRVEAIRHEPSFDPSAADGTRSPSPA
jgi:hypothetical protein